MKSIQLDMLVEIIKLNGKIKLSSLQFGNKPNCFLSEYVMECRQFVR